MTTERRFLLNLIDEWRKAQYDKVGGRYGSVIPGAKEPARVTKAKRERARLKKIVDAWDRSQQARRDKVVKQIDVRVREFQQIAHFEKPAKAYGRLKALLAR